MSETVEAFDSWVFFHIPRSDLGSLEYRRWIDHTLLPRWLIDAEGLIEYRHMNTGDWNEQGEIHGTFGGRYIPHCKLYKIDQINNGIETRRGILIRDHYSEEDVDKVMFLANRFETYLNKQHIDHRREHMKR